MFHDGKESELQYAVYVDGKKFNFKNSIAAMEFAQLAAISHASAYLNKNLKPHEIEDYEPEIMIIVK